MSSLAGTTTLVTGGASGMGAATARALAAQGAHVVVVDRDAVKGAAVATHLGGSFAPGDVTSEDDIRAAVETATLSGPLRTCIHCAGIGWAERTITATARPTTSSRFARCSRST